MRLRYQLCRTCNVDIIWTCADWCTDCGPVLSLAFFNDHGIMLLRVKFSFTVTSWLVYARWCRCGRFCVNVFCRAPTTKRTDVVHVTVEYVRTSVEMLHMLWTQGSYRRSLMPFCRTFLVKWLISRTYRMMSPEINIWSFPELRSHHIPRT